MQHCTKVPLLLNNIRRYTEDPREQQLLTVSLQKLETSLRTYSSIVSKTNCNIRHHDSCYGGQRGVAVQYRPNEHDNMDAAAWVPMSAAY